MLTGKRDLELIVGDATPFRVYLYDETDAPAVLGAADAARVSLFSAVGATPFFSKTATISAANGYLEVTPTQVEADAWVAGTYLGRATVRFGTYWRKSARFRVVVARGDVANTP